MVPVVVPLKSILIRYVIKTLLLLTAEIVENVYYSKIGQLAIFNCRLNFTAPLEAYRQSIVIKLFLKKLKFLLLVGEN